MFLHRIIKPNTDESPGDDLLDVKPLPHTAELVKPHPTPRRLGSKVSSIKKILNKKIKLNSHLTFDEEGEAMEKPNNSDHSDCEEERKAKRKKAKQQRV